MSYYLKTNRVFTSLKRYAWLFLPVVVLGGLWFPVLGLLLIPVMLTLAVLGFFGGNVWCGKICPHGSLFDQYAALLSRNRPIPKVLRSLWVRIPAFAWFGYMLGMRLMRVAQLWGELNFWDRLGYIFVMNYLVVTIVGTTLALVISPRAWCNFCPMGTLQRISLWLGRITGGNKKTEQMVTIESTDKCHTCATCARVCPMHLEPYRKFNENNQFDSYDCIRCSTCVAYCPADILSLKTRGAAQAQKQAAGNRGYESARTIQSGSAGSRDVVYEVKLINGQEVSRKQTDVEVTQQPEERIIMPGSGRWPLTPTSSFRFPMNSGRISSRFGDSRPGQRTHMGLDIAASRGTPIFAADDGVVTRRSYGSGYGYYLIIDHGNGYSTLYAHISRFPSNIWSGSRVVRGQVIAYVGNTGVSTGPHLHWEVRQNGNPLNPLNFFRYLSSCVSGFCRHSFLGVLDKGSTLL
ncbi:MAG: 4Fe-4S binding protein [Firmicutes bacterium]|nr:4Fe-4S binding protein [Bacillota bacterium]